MTMYHKIVKRSMDTISRDYSIGSFTEAKHIARFA